VNSIHALEITAVAIAGFLFGSVLKADSSVIWQLLSLLLGF